MKKTMMGFLMLAGSFAFLAPQAPAQQTYTLQPVYLQATVPPFHTYRWTYVVRSITSVISMNSSTTRVTFTDMSSYTRVADFWHAPPGGAYLYPPMDPTVAQLMFKLMDRFNANPARFTGLTIKNLSWGWNGAVYTLLGLRDTEVLLTAPGNTPSVGDGSGLEGSLLEAHMYDQGPAMMGSLSVHRFGHVRLKRADGNIKVGNLLRASLTTSDKGTLVPLPPARALDFLHELLSANPPQINVHRDYDVPGESTNYVVHGGSPQLPRSWWSFSSPNGQQ